MKRRHPRSAVRRPATSPANRCRSCVGRRGCSPHVLCASRRPLAGRHRNRRRSRCEPSPIGRLLHGPRCPVGRRARGRGPRGRPFGDAGPSWAARRNGRLLPAHRSRLRIQRSDGSRCCLHDGSMQLRAGASCPAVITTGCTCGTKAPLPSGAYLRRCRARVPDTSSSRRTNAGSPERLTARRVGNRDCTQPSTR